MDSVHVGEPAKRARNRRRAGWRWQCGIETGAIQRNAAGRVHEVWSRGLQFWLHGSAEHLDAPGVRGEWHADAALCERVAGLGVDDKYSVAQSVLWRRVCEQQRGIR